MFDDPCFVVVALVVVVHMKVVIEELTRLQSCLLTRLKTQLTQAEKLAENQRTPTEN